MQPAPTETEILPISSEPGAINPVRASSGLLDTPRNPFRCPLIKKNPSFPKPTSMAQAVTQVTSKGLSAFSSCFNHNPKSCSGLNEAVVPSVEFPYIKTATDELVISYKLAQQQIRSLPCELEDLSIDLPALSKPHLKTLILDLDGTLIRTIDAEEIDDFNEELRRIEQGENLVVNAKEDKESIKKIVVNTDYGNRMEITFEVRPFLKEFLETLSKKYELVVFSAATKEYTQKVVEKLDPLKEYISLILDRTSCVQRDESFYIKDLRIFKNRGLDRMIIIDNTVFSFHCQLENGIYIPTYEGGEDTELLKIMKFLLTLEQVKDVRPLVKKFAGVSRIFKALGDNEACEIEENTYEEPPTDPILDVEEEKAEGSEPEDDIGDEFE